MRQSFRIIQTRSGQLIIETNDGYYVVSTDDYLTQKMALTFPEGTNWEQLEFWIKESGIQIGSDIFVLSRNEVASLVEEFLHQHISHDNPLCREIVERMIKYIDRK